MSCALRRGVHISKIGTHRVTRALPALAAIIVIVACAAPLVSPPSSTFHGPGAPIWIVSHGWHVGIAMPRVAMPLLAWPERDALGPFRYLEVGWGDAEFYPAAHGTIALGLKAAFRSGGSVLHVTGFDAPVTDYFRESPIVEIEVSPRGREELARFLHREYARDAAGRTIVVAPALYGDAGFFYGAVERYSVFQNSNHWTARALRTAGCPVDTRWTLTAVGVLEQALRFGRAVRLPPTATVSRVESEDCRAPRSQ